MRTNRWSKGLTATVAAAVVSAVAASSAVAAPATFNPAGNLSWGIQGTLQLSLGNDYRTAASCTSAHVQPITGTSSNNGSPSQGFASGLAISGFCPTWPNHWGVVALTIPGSMSAESNGGIYTLSSSSSAAAWVISNSTLGPIWNSDPSLPVNTYSGVWTNGTSAANPSRLTFNATTVAKRSGTAQPVTVTGTLTVRNPQNPNGQLVTLN